MPNFQTHSSDDDFPGIYQRKFELSEKIAKAISEYTEDYEEMVMPLAEYIVDEVLTAMVLREMVNDSLVRS